jgi:hypothetical protein
MTVRREPSPERPGDAEQHERASAEPTEPVGLDDAQRSTEPVAQLGLVRIGR